MEGNVSMASPTKPSGLPRPGVSRLPVLRNRSSQILGGNSKISTNHGLPKAVTNLPNGNARPSSKPKAPRQSTGSHAHTQPIATAKPSRPISLIQAKPVTATRNAVNPRVSGACRPATVRPTSRTSARIALQQRSMPYDAIDDDPELHDELSSLGSFRSASRQGNREPSPPSREEYVEPVDDDITPRPRKPSRPSLSDRTIESLNQLPSTPGSARRRSSFFAPPESPMGPPSRPASSLSRGNSHGSRPGTSDGITSKPAVRPGSPKKAPTSAKPASRLSFGFTPSTSTRSVSAAYTSKLHTPSTEVPPSPSLPTPSRSQQPAVLRDGRATHRPVTGSKTISARQAKPRPGLGGIFAKPSAETAKDTSKLAPSIPEQKRTVSHPANHSSAALRQKIAAAKAAKRAAATQHDSPQNTNGGGGGSFDFDLDNNPFNQAPKDGKHMLRNRINSARTDGKLNIAAMGLKQIPDEVLKMYDTESMEESHVSWAEVVDVTKLIAADNELEEIAAEVFPDIDAAAAAEEETANTFGGLEMLDLHGNQLTSVPLGLRRLERLTVLNLAHNKLTNSTLDVIAHIKSLRELKLGHNCITSSLPSAICQLPNLETLDLQSNRLQSLPESIRQLVALKILNVSGNQLSSLPMEALQSLPLIDLDASANVLMGSLWPMGPTGGTHATLRELNVANNSLAALTFSESLHLPCMTSLDITNNHFAMLPDITGWTDLVTLAAGDNKIPELPKGFTGLLKLRNVNLTGNELRVLDPRIACMEGLQSLVLASNPLREKKYLSMGAADIKRDLMARLEPEEQRALDGVDGSDGMFGDGLNATPAKWTLKANGILDLAARALSDDLNDMLSSFLKGSDVRQLLLQRNRLTSVPPALWLGQDLRVLDLSSNTFVPDYLSDELSLPSLQELNLANTRLSTLEPLLTNLAAPSLRHLDLATNRLTGAVPTLRATYPALTTLLASDNRFTSVSADALRGLHTVNLASNDLAQLPADIGLLWDEGLRNFEVGSNPFRVPGYRVLEKGAEATLRWLTLRIPTARGDGGGTSVNGAPAEDDID